MAIPLPYRLAAILVTISAVLHLLTPAVGGITSLTLVLVGVGILCLALAAGLNRGIRAVAWVSFLLFGITASIPLGFSFADTEVPGGWFMAMAVAEGGAALCLLVALWVTKQPSPEMP